MSEPISPLQHCQGLFKQQQVPGRKEITYGGRYKMMEEEAVNKSESGDSPLLASPQGGVAVSSKNIAKPPKQTQPGWFSLLFSSENHPGLAVSGCFAQFS
jgi:hypothetical protein